MAFTPLQRSQFRWKLGYGSTFLQLDTILEQAMNAMDADPNASTIALALLADLIQIDSDLVDARRRQKFTRAEDLTYAGAREIMMRRSEGTRIVGQLAALFRVPIRHNPYAASTAASGPTFMSELYGPGDDNTMKQG